MMRHWVVLEAGGNQRYITASNRLRHIVGGSQLIVDAGTDWVTKAVADINQQAVGPVDPDRILDGPGPVWPVQLTSGKATLLVDTEDAGRAVIREVNRRALREAPGLEITGVVGPPFDDSATYQPDGAVPVGTQNHAEALRATVVLQGRVRAARPAQELRERVLPWHELCRETGRPAAGLELYGDDPDKEDDWHSAAASVRARTAVRARTEDRLRGLLGEHRHVLPADLTTLATDGWMAVIHADGNGVGELFLKFPNWICRADGLRELDLATHCRHLHLVAEQLQDASENALRDALGHALSAVAWSPKDQQRVLLPIVVGGDDLTLACHAGLALPLVRHYLEAFAQHTSQQRDLSRLVGAMYGTGGRQRLGAAAGIAVVKPHHPFSAALELAEALTASAKVFKQVSSTLSGFDLHVAHESTLRPLRALRDALTVRDGGVRLQRHGGPYLVGSRPAGAAADVGAWLDRQHVDNLDGLVRLLDSGRLSAARAHDLREALDSGRDEYTARCRVALARVGSEQQREAVQRGGEPNQATPGAAAELEQLLAVLPEPPGLDAEETEPLMSVRLMDAMLLQGAGLHGGGA